MKNKLLTIFISSIVLIAWYNEGKHEKESLGDTSTLLKSDTPIHAGLMIDTFQKVAVDNSTGDKILGTWAFVGDENASFVIAKDKITYPDQNVSYKYVLANDSLHIKFDGYGGNYLIKKRGSDTLILVGDEQQIYYRFKKSI